MSANPTNSKGPLSGYRIIDVTQMLSGPMATMILGDQGADVIKVEPPGIGDLTRAMGAGKRGIPPTFAVINRNKRSIAIDLKDHRGLAVLKHLVTGADVFVQNFRPGRAERMGIGERELRRIKADLIYVSISGFGEKGPYVEKRVYDPVIQALSGLAAIQTDYKTGRPQMMRLIIPDKVTALTAAQAITAALLARERSGEGQHVRLAMLDAVIAFLWPEGMARHTFISSGLQPARPDSRDLIFETANGYITCGANSNAEWERRRRRSTREHARESGRRRRPWYLDATVAPIDATAAQSSDAGGAGAASAARRARWARSSSRTARAASSSTKRRRGFWSRSQISARASVARLCL